MQKIPVVAYARFSSDNQREESVDAQIRAIKDYCDQNDYKLIKVYADEAKSATTDQRNEFQQMIRDSKTGIFRCIVVHKLDRFSRDRYDSAIYKRELKNNGVKLLSVLENLDDSPEAVILESVLEGMSEYYSKNLAREVLKGLNENALKCKHNGGIPPLGFDVDADQTYIINQHEAEAVRLIFQRYIEGCKYIDIIHELKDLGFKTKVGKDFTHTSLNAILRNEKYTGTYVYGRTEPQQKGRKRSNRSRSKSEQTRIENGMPRIISDDVWQMASKIRKEKATMVGKGAASAKEVYLLSGILYCGNCGGKMHGYYSHDKRKNLTYVKYKCPTTKKDGCTLPLIDRNIIENEVLAFIEKEIFHDDILKVVAERLQHAINNAEEERLSISIERELRSVQGKIDNAISAILSGINSPDLKNTLESLEQQKSALSVRLAKVKIEESATPELTMSKIEAFLNKCRNLRIKTRKEQQNIIRMFIKKVVVHYDEKKESSCWIDIYPIKNSDSGDKAHSTAFLFLTKSCYRLTVKS